MMDPEIAEALKPTQTEYGSSRIAELQRCPTAHQLRYVDRILPKTDAVYFDIGRYVHAGQQYINKGIIAGEVRDWQRVIDAARVRHAECVARGEAEPTAWDELDPIDEAERLLGLYYGHYGIENGGWPEGVRLTHCELFVEDRAHRATERLDLVLDRGGEIQLADTKTRGQVLPKDREEYARELRTNEQFLRSSALAQKHFGLPTPPPLWLDAIIKTASRPKDPDARWPVDRLLVRFTQDDIGAWWENQRKLLIVGEALRSLPVVRNYHECAPPIGQKCWAFNWCHGNEEARAKKYRVREVQS